MLLFQQTTSWKNINVLVTLLRLVGNGQSHIQTLLQSTCSSSQLHINGSAQTLALLKTTWRSAFLKYERRTYSPLSIQESVTFQCVCVYTHTHTHTHIAFFVHGVRCPHNRKVTTVCSHHSPKVSLQSFPLNSLC